MELIAIGFIGFVVTLMQIINFKIHYFKHQATCLDYSTGHYAFTSFPLYEYEIIEAGEKTLYRNKGTALFYPRKGKKHAVLIHKINYNKIVGYSEFVACFVLMSMFLVCILIQLMCM